MRGKFLLGFFVILASLGLIWLYSPFKAPATEGALPSPAEKLASPADPHSHANGRLAAGATAASELPNLHMTVRGDAWRAALKNTRRDSLQAIAQRASLSGKFTDIATLRVAERECQRFRMGPDVYAQSGIVLSPAQQEHLAAGRVRCAPAGTPSSSQITLRDAEGMEAVAQPMLIAMSGAALQDVEQKKQVLAAVFETRSIELLEAVSRSVLTPQAAYAAGLPQGGAPSLDGQLLDLAIRVRACTARGDCDVVGMDQLQCGQMNACVSNLVDFPAQKLLVPPEQRVPPFRSSNLTAAELQARWNDIQAFLASRTGP
jgi:hypothetical protein